MAEKSLDIPVSELPFEAGKGFVATVSDDGIAHIVVSVSETQTGAPSAVSEGDGSGFLEKWGGSLTSRDIFRKEAHLDDPRMLSYIEKYGLDA